MLQSQRKRLKASLHYLWPMFGADLSDHPVTGWRRGLSSNATLLAALMFMSSSGLSLASLCSGSYEERCTFSLARVDPGRLPMRPGNPPGQVFSSHS